MKGVTAKYEDGLIAALLDPEEAAAYLDSALEEGDQEAFLLALRDIAKARGLSNVAHDASSNRDNLRRMLSSEGDPRLSSLLVLLRSLGLRLSVGVRQAA